MAAPAAGSVLYVSLLGDRNITWISNRGYQESSRFAGADLGGGGGGPRGPRPPLSVRRRFIFCQNIQ